MRTSIAPHLRAAVPAIDRLIRRSRDDPQPRRKSGHFCYSDKRQPLCGTRRQDETSRRCPPVTQPSELVVVPLGLEGAGFTVGRSAST